ncbi:MAG: hypothetical protein JSW65_00245 [Candidatus Bipolaricaulota bacterium]|nr:MAG: hypothetical protein JSW65_00245 [Candidatus Bipolaricaulota bacterium]
MEQRSRLLVVALAASLLLLIVGLSVGPLGSGGAHGYPRSPHGRVGVYLTSHAVSVRSILDGILRACERGALNAVVVNVKNMHGEVTFATTSARAREIGAVAERLDLGALTRRLHDLGIYVIARQVLFYDPKLADAQGRDTPWVDPTDDEVVSYNLELAAEVAAMGVDELQFDYIRYPDEDPIGDDYTSRRRAISGFLERARRRLSGRVFLSVDVFGRVLWPWNARGIDPIGQVLEEMAPACTVVSPMVYPSHYSEARYTQDPYGVVRDALRSGAGRIATSIRPFLQAFDRLIPAGMSLTEYIAQQIRAAREWGADGYLFWDPACDYGALFEALSTH